ncbi:hypothetical protein Mic7113_6796 (plasmid) [Allocoleopsis franciscana PCC 7113]|uniref:Helix-turn-helix domain-containing protein n=1 Tax=Allocoleopsis franciscana PCC 7113 TaxID=1173027 RepID=K9WPN6_9CYAN|nr:hypothetical protein Mic7113_6796 [Allocoleopsis franciscana PCC 7113]
MSSTLQGVSSLSREDEETAAFQNWLWGRMSPQDFAIIWSPVSYSEIGLLCGVSTSTVQHWLCAPTAKTHRIPGDRPQRLLALIDWWLRTFNLTPQQLLAQFDQYLRQRSLE